MIHFFIFSFRYTILYLFLFSLCILYTCNVVELAIRETILLISHSMPHALQYRLQRYIRALFLPVLGANDTTIHIRHNINISWVAFSHKIILYMLCSGIHQKSSAVARTNNNIYTAARA